MVYMKDLVQEEFLEQVKERLGEFRIDGILDSGMLEQLTEDSWFSPFPQYQTTERPDRAAQEILNGKAVLLCDNSPSALILPGVFHSFMESSEDWYNRFEMASFLRILRYVAMAAATLLPGLYLAVIRFHTQILPTNMLLSFAVFVLSTKPSEFVDELEKRGFSPRFGYIVTSVFQIIPQMMGTMNTIMDAQRSRGLETEGNLRIRAKAFLPLISPVVMSSLINTRERAIALEVRGFGAGKKKTWLTERTRHKGDREITIFLGVCILAAVVWRIVGCL